MMRLQVRKTQTQMPIMISDKESDQEGAGAELEVKQDVNSNVLPTHYI